MTDEDDKKKLSNITTGVMEDYSDFFQPFGLTDIKDSQLGAIVPLDTEDDDDHEERLLTEQEEQQPIGAMSAESVLIGGMAADPRVGNPSTIKSFLTKSSGLLTASEGVGDLVRDSFYEADDELGQSNKKQKVDGKDVAQHEVQAKHAQVANNKVKLAAILKRLTVNNVARKADIAVEYTKGM